MDSPSTPADTNRSPNPQKTLDSLAALSYRNRDLTNHLHEVCDSLLEVLGDGAAAITLYRDGRKNVLAIVPTDMQPEGSLEVHGHLSTYVVENQATLRVENSLRETQYGAAPEGYCAYLGIPLQLPGGDVVGSLCYFDQEERRFDDNELQVAELFAERVAIALDNFDLYAQLKERSENLETMVGQRTKELLTARDELANKEKLAAVGKFATQITHEIRNPLTTIRLALEYLHEHGDDPSRQRAELAAGEVARMERLLTEVLRYARPKALALTSVNLGDFMTSFLRTHESLTSQQNQIFKFQQSMEINLTADRDRLTQVFLNLARNACEAAGDKGVINWSISKQDNQAKISVHNHGDLIPADRIAQITEAFVSAKPGGAGLGLAIVKSIINAHGGSLELSSNQQQGTWVDVYLPLAKP